MVVQDDRHFVNRKAAYQYSKTPNVDCSPCKNEKSSEANQFRVDFKVQISKYVPKFMESINIRRRLRI